jgi:hypothetical protein
VGICRADAGLFPEFPAYEAEVYIGKIQNAGKLRGSFRESGGGERICGMAGHSSQEIPAWEA